MKQHHWQALLDCVNMRPVDTIPVALIVDSPWVPGYVGMGTLDYYTDPELWWQAQQKIRADFPDVMFLSDYWIEFGMGNEPSGFGCKVNFYDNQPVTVQHLIHSCDDIESLESMPVPNPRRDGLMPLVLNYYRHAAEKARDIGDPIRMVAGRGPLNMACHMIGVTEFLLALKLYPDATHSLLRKTTALCRAWIESQSEAVGGASAMLLLDDIIGFLSPEDFEEFGLPYFKELYSAFSFPVKMLHNDTDNPVSYSRLADMGINCFNFTHEQPLSTVRKLCGDSICLIGNIPPLHVLGGGTPESVAADTTARLDDYGSTTGIIISAGGGASPGMPAANLHALVDATADWSRKHKA